jgi:hypothetical protein
MRPIQTSDPYLKCHSLVRHYRLRDFIMRGNYSCIHKALPSRWLLNPPLLRFRATGDSNETGFV